jgi:hypothetical protein
MIKKLSVLLLAILIAIGCLPFMVQAESSSILLNAIPDQYRGNNVIISGTSTLKELNMKVVNSQGTIIYVNTLKSENDGTYNHLFTLSATEALGKTTVVVGEGKIVATQEFLIKLPEGGGNGNGNGNGGNDGNGGSSNGGGSSANPAVPQAPSSGSVTDVEIVVNGKAQNAGKATSTIIDERVVTTFVPDVEKFAEWLNEAEEHAVITIPLKMKSDTVVGEVNGQIIDGMVKKQATIEIQTEKASYRLPANQVDIQSVSERLGKGVKLEDITVQIRIAAPEANMAKIAENAGASGGFSIVVPPVDFTVKAVYGDNVVDVARFNTYVERSIVIPEGVDPSKITTAVVIEPDGSVRHVPTQITVNSGKYYAKINSLTNSTYSLIWNPISFQDVENHWAQNAVNDLGSRKVINGVGQGIFNPDHDITRAEFATIIVNGLGLKAEPKAIPFPDIKADDWFAAYVTTAHSYKLITGFEDGTFRPTEKISREQAMVMLSNAMELTGLKGKHLEQNQLLNDYVDSNQVSEWAAAGVGACLNADLVSGRSDNRLEPGASISRAEVAAIVQRLLQKSDLI